MADVKFTEEEIGILKETLEDYVSEIASEISTPDGLSVQEATRRAERTSKIRDLIARMEKLAA